MLCEAAYCEPGKPLKIDREKCVVYGVKVLGERSSNPPPNNNVYPPETRRQSAPIMEGARAFVGHGDVASRSKGIPRNYADSIGVHRNIREEVGGLRSDFHYNPKHPLAEQFLYDAEHCPENVGFSIFAKAGGKRRGPNGEQVVESIIFDRRAHSIDLVCSGATTNTLSEESMTMPTTKKIKAVLTEAYAGDAAKISVVNLIEEDLPAEMSADMPAPEASASSDDQVTSAFKSMMYGVVDKFIAGEVDMMGMVAKLKEIAKAHGKLTGTDAEPEATPAEPAAEHAATPTVAALTEEVRQLRHENTAARVCAAANVVPNSVLRSALKSAKDEAEMKALVEEFRSMTEATPGKAKSATSGATAGKARSGGATLAEHATGINGTTVPPATATAAEKVAFLRTGRVPAKN